MSTPATAPGPASEMVDHGHHEADMEIANLLDDLFPDTFGSAATAPTSTPGAAVPPSSDHQQQAAASQVVDGVLAGTSFATATTAKATQPIASATPASVARRVSSDDVPSLDPAAVNKRANLIKKQTATGKTAITKKKAATATTTSKPKKTVTKKRKVPAPAPAPTEVMDEKECHRRERNRQHAKRSRLRKKELTSELQQSVQDLKAENAKLKQMIYDKFANNRPRADALLQKHCVSSTQAFLQALQQPANRVVDNTTRDFLATLRNKAAKRVAHHQQQQAKAAVQPQQN